nr:membrane protein insertion efficiency factor YidD [Roseofilum casamattae]
MLDWKLWEIQWLKILLIRTIQAYRRGISPLFPPSCRFYPSCSQYALTAIARFGVAKGVQLAGWRILRCNPFVPGGYDPVPEIDSFMPLKPYQKIPIRDNGEPLVPIPLEQFAVETPHPYEKLGAPYGDKSPYWLRQNVVERLVRAQENLQQEYPSWKIQIFDAYRPVAVQQFMVEYTLGEVAREAGLDPDTLSEIDREKLLEQVYQFWAVPSSNPATPPPHSTGGAVDVTLVDNKGNPVDMGSAIDEISPRSYPNYYQEETSSEGQVYHQHREILRQVMELAGFKRHPREWWHFSYGDQVWVLRHKEEGRLREEDAIASYGRPL